VRLGSSRLAQDVGEEAPLVTGDPLTRQQSLVGVPAHRRRRDLHAVGDLADGEPVDVPVETHLLNGAVCTPCLQVHLNP